VADRTGASRGLAGPGRTPIRSAGSC
jgi:hypothetical protein